MEKKCIVKLTNEEGAELNKILSNGSSAAKKNKIARVLLRADASKEGMNYTDQDISDKIEIITK